MSRHMESRDNIAPLPSLHLRLLRLRPFLLSRVRLLARNMSLFSAFPLRFSLSRPRSSLQEQDSCRPPISRTRISPLRIFNFNIFLHRAAFTSRYIITAPLHPPAYSGRVKETGEGVRTFRVYLVLRRGPARKSAERQYRLSAIYCVDIFLYVSYISRNGISMIRLHDYGLIQNKRYKR